MPFFFLVQSCFPAITLHRKPSLPKNVQPSTALLRPCLLYTSKVNFIADYDVLQSSALSSVEINDSIHYKGFPIYYKDKLYLRPKVLTDNLRITPGDLYNEQDVQRTYSNFGRLPVLKYTNVRFFETQVSDSAKLNAYVMLTKNKHQSLSLIHI